jgi:hypothetical protein
VRPPRTIKAAVDSAGAAAGKLKPAICKCGYKGKSKRPEYYQCGYCYYAAAAEGNDVFAEELVKRADRLTKEAKVFRIRALQFRERHPLPIKRKPA